MKNRIKREATAEPGAGMTAAELIEFLSGLDPQAVPRVRIRFGGSIKSIRAEEEQPQP